MRCSFCQEVALGQGFTWCSLVSGPPWSTSFPKSFSDLGVCRGVSHFLTPLSQLLFWSIFYTFLNMLSQRHHQLISSALSSNRSPSEPAGTGSVWNWGNFLCILRKKPQLPAPLCGHPTQRTGLECYGSLSGEAEAWHEPAMRTCSPALFQVKSCLEIIAQNAEAGTTQICSTCWQCNFMNAWLDQWRRNFCCVNLDKLQPVFPPISSLSAWKLSFLGRDYLLSVLFNIWYDTVSSSWNH